MIGPLISAAAGAIGGLFGGGGGGGDPIGQLQAAQDKALQDQARMLALQADYQSKKAALDLVSSVLNSDHQSKEQIAQKLSDS